MGKYDNMRKHSRNKMIAEYRYSHPELSLQELASLFNISKQRVWAILKAHQGKSVNGGNKT